MRVARCLLLAIAALAASLAQAQQRYWYDGEVRRPLWAEPAVVVDFAQAARGAPVVPAPAGLEKSAGAHRSPVFRDAASPGSPLRAPAGGVIVRLRPGTTDAQRAALFAKHGISQPRRVGGQDDVWLAPAPAGVASLDLANLLHETGDFASASPNWWKARTLK